MKQPLNSRLESWQAKLCLRADCPRGETRVRKLHQQGPLQIQKILYPEGPSIAHAFVLHPPSGIAQDDQLRIEISAVQESHSVYCAPGATRWYRSFPGAPRPAQQHILLNLSQRSSLEWLPYENLYFDQTWAQNTLEVRLEPGCRLLGWDVHQFGRSSCNESWIGGRALTSFSLYLSNKLIWIERARWLSEGMEAQNDHHQLAGYSIVGSLWAFGPRLNEETYEALAASLPFDRSCVAGVSQLLTSSYKRDVSVDNQPVDGKNEEALLIMRFVSKNPEQARTICERTRAFLRPLIMKEDGSDLRIWAT
ncbi:MAG: urease accessory protein UreD [Burkholderiaceae bacterium]|jgi:urease accessory protein